TDRVQYAIEQPPATPRHSLTVSHVISPTTHWLGIGGIVHCGQSAVSQLALFAEAGEKVLVDDARGRIVYTSDFVPPEVARAWFDEVREAVAWEAQRRRMYDREVDVPRLVGHFRLAPEAAPRRAFHLDLAAGSLLVMSYETQLHYTHGVPKMTEPVGPRISLAFRARP